MAPLPLDASPILTTPSRLSEARLNLAMDWKAAQRTPCMLQEFTSALSSAESEAAPSSQVRPPATLTTRTWRSLRPRRLNTLPAYTRSPRLRPHLRFHALPSASYCLPICARARRARCSSRALFRNRTPALVRCHRPGPAATAGAAGAEATTPQRRPLTRCARENSTSKSTSWRGGHKTTDTCAKKTHRKTKQTSHQFKQDGWAGPCPVQNHTFTLDQYFAMWWKNEWWWQLCLVLCLLCTRAGSV